MVESIAFTKGLSTIAGISVNPIIPIAIAGTGLVKLGSDIVSS